LRKPNLRTIVAILIFAGLALASGYLLLSGTNRDLTLIGRRFTELKPSPGVNNSIILGWLPDEKLLACYFDAVMPRNYFVVDMRTGVKTMLPALSASVNGSDGSVAGSLSPDRKWLLYAGIHVADRYPQECIAVSLDGSRVERYKCKSHMEWIWSGDSKGAFALDDDTRNVSKWSLSDSTLLPIISPHLLPASPYPGWKRIGPVPGDLLFYSQTDQPGRLIQFGRIDERGDQKVIGTTRVPFDGYCGVLDLSPSGRKLAWLIRYEIKPPKSALQLRINSWVHIQSGYFDSIWTSDVDGSNLHELGFIKSDSSAYRHIGRTGWMQDGKRLWFDFDNAIWTVPVDP